MWRRVMAFLGLELFAVLLALAQFQVGLRTDEAKYLLNIPYPHPPLVRWILGLTEWMPFQELFWRIVFSSLVIQAGWFLLQSPKNQEPIKPESQKIKMKISFFGIGSYLVLGSSDLLPVITWLFSSAVLLQAGGVMMAPLTALQALAFLWLRRRLDLVERFPGFIALLWLASLFTAYQAILFAPIVLFIFFATQPWKRAVLYVCTPVALLALYTLTNPLVLASFVILGSGSTGQPLIEKLSTTLHFWILGGSLIGSIIGTIGIFQSRRWELIGSLILVSLYIIIAQHDYYAVLFAPLFAAGVASVSLQWNTKNKGPMAPYFLVVLMIASAIYFVTYSFPSVSLVSARETMRAIHASGGEGTILISGPFGHEWQYESRVPVGRYREELLSSARAVICLQPCVGIESAPGWERLPGASVPAWIRR